MHELKKKLFKKDVFLQKTKSQFFVQITFLGGKLERSLHKLSDSMFFNH